ncbi:MAG: DJ-1/PfpI family protein [Acidobacteriota bacterium]
MNPLRIGLIGYDDIMALDLVGPTDAFTTATIEEGNSGQQRCYEVLIIGLTGKPFTAESGIVFRPHKTLQTAPALDTLIIPGGRGLRSGETSAKVMAWVKSRAAQIRRIASVCTGIYGLAPTGLLDGLTATTFYDLIDGLPTAAPKVKVVRDQRYVDNGKFITTAGLSSGIDGALYVVTKLFGKGKAQMVALNMEYDWKADSTYARASFADRPIRKVFGRSLRLPVPQGIEVKVLSTEGTTRNWEVKWQLEGNTTPADVLKLLSESLNANEWTEQKATSSEAVRRLWKFNDDGQEWQAVTEVVSASTKLMTISLKIECIKR